MHLEPVSQAFTFFEDIVQETFANLPISCTSEHLPEYVVLTLGSFLHMDAMGPEFERRRAFFSIVENQPYFDAIVSQIQKGDKLLFHSMFYDAAPYDMMVRRAAAKNYGLVAVLLKPESGPKGLYAFMASNMDAITGGMQNIREKLNFEPVKVGI